MRKRVRDVGLEDKILVDSAGTHAYQVGEAPDQRSIASAKKRGIVIDGLRARKIAPGDFHEFDLILGLGDYQYPDGTLAHYNAYFDKDWGPLVPKMYPVLAPEHGPECNEGHRGTRGPWDPSSARDRGSSSSWALSGGR